MLRWNLAGLVVLTGAFTARADDVIRLGRAAPGGDVIRLGAASTAAADDTLLVAHRGYGGGYHGHGYSHGYGGYRGHGHSYGYGGGYHGHGYSHGYGARSYYHHGYYGSSWGHSYYPRYGYARPYFYASFANAPYYYSSYAPYYYYPPVNSYYATPQFYLSVAPIAEDVTITPEAVRLGSSNFNQREQRAGPIVGPAGNGDGTFRYDGGPKQTIPIPDAVVPTAPAPRPAPPPNPMPLNQKMVKLPAAAPLAYPAYSEALPALPLVTFRFAADTTSTATPAQRLSYPAYGESTTPNVLLKTSAR